MNVHSDVSGYIKAFGEFFVSSKVSKTEHDCSVLLVAIRVNLSGIYTDFISLFLLSHRAERIIIKAYPKQLLCRFSFLHEKRGQVILDERREAATRDCHHIGRLRRAH
jgi:hypothetical protein